MPAYRSSDEADIRNDVVAHLRKEWPSARIIHEINCAGTGSNRIDVLAVTEMSIAAVEIKSKKDKLDRLPDQLQAMQRCAHISIAAIHEKFLVEKETNKWNAERTDDDGRFWKTALPPEIEAMRWRVSTWVWPQRPITEKNRYDERSAWRLAPTPLTLALPHGALDMLWANELRWLCAELRIGVGKRANMGELVNALRWMGTGRDLTRGVCAALRRRDCVEADAPIIDGGKPWLV